MRVPFPKPGVLLRYARPRTQRGRCANPQQQRREERRTCKKRTQIAFVLYTLKFDSGCNATAAQTAAQRLSVPTGGGRQSHEGRHMAVVCRARRADSAARAIRKCSAARRVQQAVAVAASAMLFASAQRYRSSRSTIIGRPRNARTRQAPCAVVQHSAHANVTPSRAFA